MGSKKTRNVLIELLLIFFALANLSIFSVAKGYYGANSLYIIRVMPAQRYIASQRLKDMGAEWAREEFNWQTLNPARGRYDLANADQAIRAYQSQGIKVVGLITYSSLWGSSNPGAGTDAQFYKPNITYWNQYISVLVRRYGHYVKHWEIWNEPNAFWKPAPNPEDYRDILVNAYDTIKSIDPAAQVASGGTTYIDGDYISRYLNDGGWEHLDAISIHYYPGAVGPESNPANKLREELSKLVYNIMIPRGGGKEIWITEMGWQSHDIGEEAQGEVISRAIILARTINEVGKIMVYNLRDETGNSYGLMRNRLQPKPAYNYYKETVKNLGSKRISQWFDLDNNSKFYIFNDAGGAVAAAWNPDRNQITGFHVNASGMTCYDLNGADVTSSVVMSWNNGDVTFSFGPRPVFCQLPDYHIAKADQEKINDEPFEQVAGVSSDELKTKANNLFATVSGTIYSHFKNPTKGEVTIFQENKGKWKKLKKVAVAGSYRLQLPEGKYFLSLDAPGHLSTKTKPFSVKGDSDVNVQASLFNSWIAYASLAGGLLVLIFFVLKYTLRKSKKT